MRQGIFFVTSRQVKSYIQSNLDVALTFYFI
nr:MAG TPA: hypothetical protein [Caudoviricetes sp.]